MVYLENETLYCGKRKNMRSVVRILIFITLAVVVVGCKKESSEQETAPTDTGVMDLAEIEEAGELICVTLNGPDTYYEYHGRGAGLQYTLAEMFANDLGLRLRMETAADTLEMLKMLRDAKADIIAFELPLKMIKDNGLVAAGARSAKGSWAVNKCSEELAAALKEWYGTGVRQAADKENTGVTAKKYKRRTDRAVFFSKSSGVVSDYDMLFLRAGRICGWDWKLLASQCYQESGFDPEAVSWAGARGLMQIMPSTAKSVGVEPDDLLNPEVNVTAAAKIIKQLEGKLGEIKDPNERKKFVLAAYNGGYGHIDDAMRLARKHGRNPHLWDDVGFFVLHLSEARYYRDPVVRYGYMIGSETFNYVNSVMGRWNGYHAVLRNAMPKGSSGVKAEGRPGGGNRFTGHREIVGRDDSLFNIRR